MEFGLSEDQKLLQESIRGTLERVSPLERVRKIAEAREAEAAGDEEGGDASAPRRRRRRRRS